jgi:hypothetical protein
MNVTIKHVGVGSAFKVGVVLNIIIFAVFGLIALVMQLLFASAFSAAFRNSTGSFSTFDLNTIGIPILCMGYVVGIIIAGIFGGIGFAIYALIYNLASGMIGGLQVQLSRENQ